MKTKEVKAAHLHKGQRLLLWGSYEGGRIASVLTKGQTVEVSIEGAFYPVLLPASQWVRVKL